MNTAFPDHLFNFLPYPSLLLSIEKQEFKILDINLAYLNTNLIESRRLVGKSIFEIPSMLASTQVELRASLTSVLSEKMPQKLPQLAFSDLLGKMQYWEVTHTPLLANDEITAILQTMVNVTEQVSQKMQLAKLEESMAKKEELLQQAEVISKFGTWDFDLVTKKIYWSEGVYRICGYLPNEFEVDLEKGMAVVHPDDRAMAYERLESTLKTSREYKIEKRFVTKDNKIKHIISRGSLIKDETGKPIKLFGVFQDVTDEKLQQIALQKTKEELHKIMESSLDMICTIDSEGRFVQVSEASFKILGYRPEELVGNKFVDFLHPADRTATLARESKIKGGIDVDNFQNRYLHKGGWEVPMTWSSTWDEIDQLYYSVARDSTENKATQQALVESVERYKYLFENNPSPMFIWDFKTLEIVDCNEIAHTKYGYTREEFLALSILDLRPKSEIQEVFEVIKSEENYEKLYRKTRIHHTKNGEIIKVEGLGRLMDYQGRRVVLVQINDVTEKEKALQELKDNEVKLRTATNIAKLGYWQINLKEQSIYWSDEMYVIWGCNPDSFVPTQEVIMATLHPDDREKFKNEFTLVLNNQKSLDIEYRIILPDGAIKWIHEIGKLISDSQQAILLEGTVQDITEQKNIQQSLFESNERYKYVSKATFDAIWDWDLVQESIFWGEGYFTIFGYKYEYLTTVNESWTRFLHPDDVARVLKSIHQAIQGDTLNWYDEYRFLKADGKYAYVIDRGFLIRDEKGKAIRMVGAMQDITSQKERERQLKLLESVVINSNDAVLITEAEPFSEPGPKIIYVNEAFTKMTGYTPEEVIGKTPRILQGPKSDRAELARLGKALRNWEICEITTINYKKNGEAFWINFTVVPVADETGWFTHWVAIERDITEVKQAEEAQRQLKELELSLEKEREFNTLKNRFTALASHEFRTPLATIVSSIDILDIYVGMIENENLKNKTKIHLDKIIFQSKRLTEMLRDILLLEKNSVNQESFQLESVDIIQLIHQVNNQYCIDEKDGRILDLKLPTENRLIISNASFLNHILSNLVNNAFKYSPNAINPSLELVFNPNSFSLIISDYGIGIPLVDQAHLFELFFRANNVLQIDGTGLGLTIAKEFTNILGGEISFASVEGEGTAFTLTFPYESKIKNKL